MKEGVVESGSGSSGEYGLDSWPLAVKRVAAGGTPSAPAAVGRPRSTEDVVRALAWARENGRTVVPWGAGSSVTGAALDSDDSLLLDLRGLDTIVDIDAESGYVRAGAGVMGGDLERALAAQGLTTRFSPQSLLRSTIGGWVATRASGQLSSRWGGIEEAVARLTVVGADGRVFELGTPPRGAVGPDLLGLFIGSEGAFGVITEVVLRVYPDEPLRGLDAFALPTVGAGLDVLRALGRDGLRPALLRLYDPDEAGHLAAFPAGSEAALLCAFAGPAKVASAEHEVVVELVREQRGRSVGPAATESWLRGRYDFSRLEALLAEPGGYAETIEVAAPWGRIVAVYAAMKRALTPLADEVLGHFSHVYADGTSLYVIMTGRARDDREAVTRLESIWTTAMRTALQEGAVISHHHGIGQARARFLPDQLGNGHDLLRAVKQALDPHLRLHPSSLGLGAGEAT